MVKALAVSAGIALLALARRSPPRGPPFWKSRVLRRQVLGDEDDGQGYWVPQTA